MSAHCLVLSCLYIVTRTRTVAQVMSLSHHPHGHVHVSFSPRLALPFYFTHFLPHSFHFLLHLKFVDYNLLRTPHKEGMDLSDEFLLSTGYEPNGFDSKETSVEPYMQLLDSPNNVSSADPDYDDAALEDMLHQAHRAHAYHSLREDLSVSLSSSSMSDRTRRPVGDRTGRPVEQRNQEAQMTTLLNKRKEPNLAECQARINKHEFQAAYDRRSPLKLGEIVDSQKRGNFILLELKKFNDEINNFFVHSCSSKIWNYLKLIRKVSTKWKNQRSFRVPPSTLLHDEN